MLVAVARQAVGFGLSIGTEFLRSSELKNLQAAERLLAKSDQPNTGHIIDALHLQRVDDVAADIRRLPPESLLAVQICDAPLAAPPEAELRAEVRDRRLPGDGEPPLDALLDAVPPDVPAEIEVPVAALAHLPLTERARRAHAAGMACLMAYEARRRGSGR